MQLLIFPTDQRKLRVLRVGMLLHHELSPCSVAIYGHKIVCMSTLNNDFPLKAYKKIAKARYPKLI